MRLFTALVVVHVVAGAVGLVSFWIPLITAKGAAAHRRWGRLAARALMVAGIVAVGMALLSLFGPEQRLPMIRDRTLFRGLFGWMMLYLALLTISFADYGLATARLRQRREPLRRVRHQMLFGAVIAAAINCAVYGWSIGQPLMVLVAAIGLIATATQLIHVWRRTAAPRGYVAEHFRALIGMGISAYTAFLSVGLIRLLPDHVFNPLIWAVPSVVGVTLILRYTLIEANRGGAANARRARG